MKICVLDGFTLNPGDLSWDKLESLAAGNCSIYDRTNRDEIVARAFDAEIVLTNKVILKSDTIAALPKLRYIGVLATGYNVVDIEAATKKGIVVTNIPAYSTLSVAQMVFSHLLNVANHTAHYADEVRNGRWAECKDFCFTDSPLMELAGKTMGIFGLGHTGMATAKIALAFGMKVIAKTSKKQEELPNGITPVGFDRFLSESDVISLNCPLTDTTRGLIDKSAISKMKQSAILINTGRGPLVVEEDVANALNNGQIAAFCADVLSKEPPQADNPLLSAKNSYITPHIAWASFEARQRLMEIAVENVRRFIAHEPIANRIN